MDSRSQMRYEGGKQAQNTRDGCLPYAYLNKLHLVLSFNDKLFQLRTVANLFLKQ